MTLDRRSFLRLAGPLGAGTVLGGPTPAVLGAVRLALVKMTLHKKA
jgi:hypothetical protein